MRERGRGREGSGAVGCGRIIVMVMWGERRKKRRGRREVGNVRERHVAGVKRTEEVRRQEKYREENRGKRSLKAKQEKSTIELTSRRQNSENE